MKISVVTGKQIFDEINRLIKEISELEKALDVLDDELSQISIPYKIVDNQRQEKARELTRLYTTKYEIKDV